MAPAATSSARNCAPARPRLLRALSRPGRYQHVADNLRVKEVRISETERFVVCYNPEAAQREATIREQMLTWLRELIDDTDRLPERKWAELRGVISTRPRLNRYLRVTPGGLLRIDAAAITAEAKLDGKYLLRTWSRREGGVPRPRHRAATEGAPPRPHGRFRREQHVRDLT